MELVSGYRDQLIAFSETMAQWYRSFQTCPKTHCEKRCLSDTWGYGPPRYPIDEASPLWILHLLDCTASPPAVHSRLSQSEIDPADLTRCEGDSVLMVTDASGLPLGFDVLSRGWAGSLGGGEAAGGDGKGAVGTTQRMVGLLRRCMEAPMSGGLPRRPQTLRVNDRKLHRLLSRSERAYAALRVVLCPQALGDWGPTTLEPVSGEPEPQEFSMRWPSARYCHVCKKHSFPSQLKPCSQCKAVLYCSDQCSQADWTRSPEDASHQHWCDKLAVCMSHAAQLADLPFTYTAEVTQDDFDMEYFLKKNKLDSGYWLLWSLLVRSPRYELHTGMEQSREPVSVWLAGHLEPYGPLLEESDTLLCKVPHNAPSLSSPLVSWRQYFAWRRLNLASPVAALLSSPLSIYYIITSLVPRDFPELNILKKQSLKIHIIESYREFNSLLVFWELSVLLPHVSFELCFIGERLPPESDEQQYVLQKKEGLVTLVSPSFSSEERIDKKSIRVKVYRRVYHMLQGSKPDLVIGFRPAIPLHDLWVSTLPRLQTLRVPAYFCELSEPSCEGSLPVMSSATGGALSPAHLNPFHCPLRICGGDNLLPWYSNAFIFHLVYKPAVSCPIRPSLANPQPIGPVEQQQAANQRAGARQSPPPVQSKLTRKERKQAARNMPRKRK
ncbi:zinc finger MYND domain-containing protein 15-like [Alosa sapidissima]|uniref:zinc finger MYND domain-containing protein 15-like n=1 Tax=Alosa sapidissima TaxID=34773 RepID=UPI001C0A6610|nr:zinc finger MYND domain-containing protein 15-like [Alosa sapidissima]